MIKLHHIWQLHISMFICILIFADKLYRVIIIAYISGLIKYKLILSLPICTLATTLYCIKESKYSYIFIFKISRYRNNFHNLHNCMILSWNILESSEYGRYLVRIFRNTVFRRSNVSDKIKLNDRRKESSKKSCKIISTCDSPITFLKKEETTCNNSTWLQIELMQLATV